jgi:hypothetical protein
MMNLNLGAASPGQQEQLSPSASREIGREAPTPNAFLRAVYHLRRWLGQDMFSYANHDQRACHRRNVVNLSDRPDLGFGS